MTDNKFFLTMDCGCVMEVEWRYSHIDRHYWAYKICDKHKRMLLQEAARMIEQKTLEWNNELISSLD